MRRSLYAILGLIFTPLIIFTAISYAAVEQNFYALTRELGVGHLSYLNSWPISDIPKNRIISCWVKDPSKLDFFEKDSWVEVKKNNGGTWEIKDPETKGKIEFSVMYEGNRVQVVKISSSPHEHKTVIKDPGLPLETDFTFSAGYRKDDLDWSIAGEFPPGNYVNILSELTWDDVEIFQLKFQNKTVIPNIFYLRAAVSYGWIYEGDVQDSDYLGNDRTLEFSRSISSSDDDDVFDASIGIGYPIRLGGDVIWTVTPMVGYSYHEQNLTTTDGKQIISDFGFPMPLGPFSGLDSTYET